ncbi:MAG: SIMPL domain-containing protein [Hyphomicrobiaceae bacterium]|nr:SIMPL domain-containing protein [Hyphomicrobiaceae bacterium]
MSRVSTASAALLLVLASLAAAAHAAEPERSITVSAQASVAAEPDIAYFSAGIATDAETARDALARNAVAMTRLLDGLRAAGLAGGDIQTAAVNVEPRYTLAKDNRTQVLSGYRVTNQLHLIVRDIRRMGEIMDQAIVLGATQLGRVAFEVSNADRLKDEARKSAMANARKRAELYAAAAGVTLGPVLRIFEEPAEARLAPVGVHRALSGSVPIEPGSRTLSSEVQVTWGLR